MQLEIEQKISQEKEKIFTEIENFLAINLEQKKALESYVSMLLQENGKYNFIGKSTIDQIWKFRIPNPNANKGLSAGLRLFAYFKKDNSTFYLYKIYQKNEVDKISNIEQLIKQEILKTLQKSF